MARLPGVRRDSARRLKRNLARARDGRHPRLESLEERVLLSATPIDDADKQFLLAGLGDLIALSASLDQFETWCRGQGATAVEVTWGEGPGSPAPMYLARGYEPSGKIVDGEIHAVKQLI